MYTQKIAVILDDSRLGLENKFVLNKLTQSPLLFYKVNWTASKYSHFTFTLYDGERNRKMSHSRNRSNCIENFREINTEALVILKRLNFI